jgi:hypothetical protein
MQRLTYLTLVVLMPFGVADSSAQKPKEKVEWLVIDGAAAAPTSLKELANQSDLVGILRVESASGESMDDSIVTAYTMVMTRLVRSNQVVTTGDRVIVRVQGGSVEDRKVIFDQVPPLVVGAEYLLFLNQYGPRGGFTIAFPSESVFRIVDGRLQGHTNKPSQRAYASERGRPVEQVIGHIMSRK